jgi:transcriptional regulator with XRE-family HTH domain
VDERECRAYLADNIRRIAKRHRISIERVADLAGLSRSTVWALLAQKHNPTLRTLVVLANALNCRPQDLIAVR